ncbi:S-adenosyl-L-methionine-dependent methyltransferase [Stachybotrys elegans]|uniref:S-adenosyl-L-methionine-dependent methyltransferase n=1 Tax=Stachybotrys elegans TaxID=80388 RepID=A0A8K0WV18_9HYPO|nr:S-adenosyl-L-methionine-dependent methyltransferase [Stachybotrys elegans]
MSSSGNIDKAAQQLSDLYRNTGATNSAEENQIRIAKTFLSKLVAPLLPQVGVSESTQKPVHLLDLACGTGVVTQEIQLLLPKNVLEQSSFLSTDSSEGLVNLVKRRIEAEKWINTSAQVVNAMAIEAPDDTFTHTTVSLGLHIIPKPDDTIRECLRVLKSGGIFGGSTPYNDPTHSMWQPDIRSAFASFPFEAPFPDPFPNQVHSEGNWADPDWIKSHLQELGLKDVDVKVCRGEYHVFSVEDFIKTFGGMLGWIIGTWWDEKTREAHPIQEVEELIRKHLGEKYDGKGWDIRWGLIYFSGRADK